ncbi:MAG: membrane protein insertase YidC, partial [Candidatus Zixiibacteriota bacterium]
PGEVKKTEVDTLISREEAVPYVPQEIEGQKQPSAPQDTTQIEKLVKVETDLYQATFSTRGANLKSFVLKEYEYSDGNKIEVIPQEAPYALNIDFPLSGLHLDKLNFSSDQEEIFINEIDSVEILNFTLDMGNGSIITKRYIFSHNHYNFDLHIGIQGIKDLNPGRQYILGWESGVGVTETNRKEDLSYFEAYAMMGEELVKEKKFQRPKGSDTGILKEERSGNTQWAATRSKYFMATLVPLSREGSGFVAEGIQTRTQIEDEILEDKRIGVAIEMSIPAQDAFQDSFMVYVGPIDYRTLKSYNIGLDKIVNLGWKYIRPFSIFVLWLFVNLYKVFANYGVVIIIFTGLMKVIFHPLTHKSVKAQTKMQEVQPLINELREKYKKDPQRLNQEIMKLYKEYKVNPFGGCLPLLLQMPLFWALFTICRSTIELRQANFIFWLNDLSQMDPYRILPIIMAATMFWQQKITIKDPKQKAMVYFMPILFFFFFQSFPAGLTLYWTFFNIFSLIEQYYIKWQGRGQPLVVVSK